MTTKTARAVYPNAGVEAWYRNRLQKLAHMMAQDLFDRVTAAWRAGGGLGAWAQDARPKPSTSLLLERAMSRWADLWQRRFTEASRSIAWNFAAKNRSATHVGVARSLRDAGFTVKYKPGKTARTAFDSTVAENVGLIKSIPQRFLTDVEAVVWGGVRSGMDLQAVSEGIRAKYAVSWRRAALIARDQNAKAKAAIERAEREELGITEAIWQHSHAGVEPRPTHVAMDQQRYTVTQGMWDSEVQKYIWPGTEINCRCTDRAVIPGFG